MVMHHSKVTQTQLLLFFLTFIEKVEQESVWSITYRVVYSLHTSVTVFINDFAYEITSMNKGIILQNENVSRVM